MDEIQKKVRDKLWFYYCEHMDYAKFFHQYKMDEAEKIELAIAEIIKDAVTNYLKSAE